jgi:hypothetical protein
VRQRITLNNLNFVERSAEDARSFARAIHGHPTITSFKGGEDFPYKYVDTLFSALATLPALESITLFSRGHHTGPEESALANPESLTNLLRSPSLRSVCFTSFYFTRALCQAAANAFMEGTAVTKIEFRVCLFSDEESATIMASGLRRNTSIASIHLATPSALPPNFMLPPFLGCTFRIDIVAMLQDNATLESLSILSQNFSTIEDYFVLVTALQHNATLKSLDLRGPGKHKLTNDAEKQMAALLKKNYALEKLPGFDLQGDVGAVLRLNEAGRRYLIEDGSSISKGVEVLSNVKNDLNCVFLHLLENPRLCDRRAVEMVNAGG